MAEPDDNFLDELLDERLLSDESPKEADDETGPDDSTFESELMGITSAPGQDGETVGLDDTAGLIDEAFLYQLDMPPTEDTGDGGVDDIPLDEALEGGRSDTASEYGWVDQPGAAEETGLDAVESDLPTLAPLGRDRTDGEEGVEHVFAHDGEDDDAVPGLPPLRGALDEDEDEDQGVDLGYEPVLELRPFEALPPEQTSAAPPRRLIAGAIGDLCAADALWAVGAGGVYRGGDSVAADGCDGVPESVAAAADGAWVLVSTTEGVFRSVDRGSRFAPVPTLRGPGGGLLAAPDGTVWLCGPTGRLQRSADGGATWSPPLLLTKVAATAIPASSSTGVLALLAPRAGRPQLALSTDGGNRWGARDAPALGRPDRPSGYSLAACGAYVAVASAADSGGPFLSSDRGRTWVRMPGLPATHALALRIEGRLAVYAAHARGAGSVLVRYVPESEEESGAVLHCEGRISRVVFDDAGGLLVATDDGLLTVAGGRER